MDTLLGLAIVGVLVTTLLSSLSTGMIGLKNAQEIVIAESLMRSQLESIKGQSYSSAGEYTLITAPTGYTITSGIETISGANPNAMQQVVVTINHGSKVLRVVRDFKVNR